MLLEVNDLSVEFLTSEGVLSAVSSVSFAIDRGETLAVVGESGCGKSVLALSLCRLHNEPPARVFGTSVLLDGENLLTASVEQLQRIRGKRVAYIFQDPQVSLNPVMRVGDQIAEALVVHNPSLSKEAAFQTAVEGLRQVKIAEPEKRATEYPHQLSGGMRQRVMIAMAMVLEPALLVADEPTTALDVSVQRQILDLIDEKKREHRLAVLFITHDLSLVFERADKLMVMYLGKVVEAGDTETVMKAPHHPYTKALLQSIPNFSSAPGQAFYSLPGEVPNPMARPKGCAFQNRCAYAEPHCKDSEPPLESDGNRLVACFEVKRVAAS